MSLPRDLLYAAGAAVTMPVWGWSLLRTGKWRTDWAGRFGRGEALPRREGATLLIHAVSVGEVNAIRDLVAWFELHDPDLAVAVASTTNTGFARATELFADRHEVVRYPLDFSRSVRRFLERVKPDVVALTELEVWPNFVQACHARSIPVAVINGRLSERSFARYRLIRPALRSTFAKLAAAAVQTGAYAERFEAMGVPADRVHVLDTMKWDTARIADHVEGADALAGEMGIDRDRPIVVAGSTGPGEEATLIEGLEAWPTGTQLLLVPRKPERFDEVAQLHPHVVRRTRPDGGSGDLFLLDTMGELRKAYALADVVVVGRTFGEGKLGTGGSDPIEPVALGRATVVGPSSANFSDVIDALAGPGGVRVAADAAGVIGAVAELLTDADERARLADVGRGVIETRQGGTRRHAELLQRLLRGAGS